MRAAYRCLVALLLATAAGCATFPTAHFDNPTLVPEPRPGGYDRVWDATVQVLERYFDVAYENRYDGRIETIPQPSASLGEVWLHDTVDLYERLEGTLQSTRRRCYAQLQPAPQGGYFITIEVYKELEDLPQPVYAHFGGGTLIQSIQPIREDYIGLNVAPGLGWISLGRDTKLEARILADLHHALDHFAAVAP